MGCSHTDSKCSGRPSCEIDVMILIKHSKPCPLELSSYLEASFNCVNGNNCFGVLKLCRSGMLRKDVMSDRSVRVVQICYTLSIRTVLLLWSQFQMSSWCVFKSRWICKALPRNWFWIEYFCYPLFSVADKLCSGRESCEIQVYSIVTQYKINPCPLELSSFMETSYNCVPGNFYWA